MIYEFVVLTLGISFILYTLLGGADFGAGAVAMFTREETRDVVFDAIAPVWEANHVWLIVVIVILFVGFPGIYTGMSIYLHLPLLLVLLGIILRGSTFAFTHYDVADGQPVSYEWMFYLSSLITPFFMGMILGAMMAGTIDPDAPTFYGRYVAGWMGWFQASMGVFSTVLFGYVASVLLTGESERVQSRKEFVRMTKYFLGLSIAGGGLVFLVAFLKDVPLVESYLDSGISIGCLIGATLLIPVMFFVINKRRVLLSRIVVGAQLSFVISGWFAAQYPNVIHFREQEPLTLRNTMASHATMSGLALALLAGLILVVPTLGFLFYVFKRNKNQPT